jgi:hypothetical protein
MDVSSFGGLRIMREKSVPNKASGWFDSSAVCALSDSDRHLGHVVFDKKKWNAFDATHLNAARDGFKYLGAYPTAAAAKAAVEASVAPTERVRHAGGMWIS